MDWVIVVTGHLREASFLVLTGRGLQAVDAVLRVGGAKATNVAQLTRAFCPASMPQMREGPTILRAEQIAVKRKPRRATVVALGAF